MKKFEIGNTYTCRSIGDHNCKWSYTVTARTASTITVISKAGEQRFRISKKISEYCGVESIYPLGQYSMAPILRAE